MFKFNIKYFYYIFSIKAPSLTIILLTQPSIPSRTGINTFFPHPIFRWAIE